MPQSRQPIGPRRIDRGRRSGLSSRSVEGNEGTAWDTSRRHVSSPPAIVGEQRLERKANTRLHVVLEAELVVCRAARPKQDSLLRDWQVKGQEKGTGTLIVDISSEPGSSALMPRAPRASAGGLCYHVLNRGNGRRQVFFKDGDYQAFPRPWPTPALRSPLSTLRPRSRPRQKGTSETKATR